jgi:hypothetical protein
MLNDKIKKKFKKKLKFKKIVLFQITVFFKEGNFDFPSLISSYELDIDSHSTSGLNYYYYYYFCKK